MTTIEIRPPLPDAPYKGLAPFTEDDAPFFFGRSVERNILLASLRSARLTLLYGASGVGKSSLLRAGFVPYVRAIARENLRRYGAPEVAVATVNEWRDAPGRPTGAALAPARSGGWAEPFHGEVGDLPPPEVLRARGDRLHRTPFPLFGPFQG